MMTIALTEEAQKHLDHYLARMKWSLYGARSVDIEDVRRDVLAHIDTELDQDPKPVSWDRLEAVLKKLGSPSQWLSVDEVSWWRRVLLRLWTGPEDWRLAYLCFGLFMLAMVPLPSMIVFLPASFILARATTALVAQTGEELGARRWLVYPPLILVSLLFTLLLVAPLVGAVGGTMENWRFAADRPEVFAHWHTAALATFAACSVLGAWWVLLGVLFACRPGMVRLVYYPFVQWILPRHGWLMAAVGVLALGAAAALWFFHPLG